MLKSYFIIAWRNLVKDRQFTILNLLGLSTGLACALLIFIWVSDEWRVDKYNKNGDRVYRVMQNIPLDDGGIMTTESTPDLLAKALMTEVPGIEDAAIVKTPDVDENAVGIISVNNTGIRAKELYVTDNFFDIFSFQLAQGDKAHVFSDKHSILLSEEMAVKLFHSTRDVIGRTVTWYGGLRQKVNGTYTVSGIFLSPPANATLQFDVLFPHQLFVETSRQDIGWGSSNPSTFLVLKKGIDVAQLNNKIKGFIKAKTGGAGWSGTLFLQRYEDQYLHNHYENGKVTGGRIEYVRLFSIIAIFILIIACINFMNLSTAKASGRLKEVGIKKVVGASRRSLILQYIGESMLMAFLSLGIALLLVKFSLPAFREITGKSLSLPISTQLLLSVTAITLFTGFVAGSYPALYLSGFKPVAVLKGRLTVAAGESWIRKGLVVFQFACSIILIVSVLVVYRQMKLIQTKDLGYSKDNIVRFSNEGGIQQNLPAFLSEVRNIPGVVKVSDVEGDMFENHSGGGGIDWPGKTARVEFSGFYADYDFMDLMGFKMKEGHMFSKAFGADSLGVIFNETAIAAMKLKDPLGKTVSLWGNKKHIIGVVKDFHFESLYKKVGPFFICHQTGSNNILTKIKTGAEKETLAQIEDLYKKYNPGFTFEYKFLDEDYRTLYASENRVALLSRCFAGIAIIISCLGLFGLTAFTAQRRQKEIGIRKVVGASVGDIAAILSTDSLKLVLIALLIALPLSWWAASRWLQSFAYRISLGSGVFLITALAVVLITLLTISFQTIKAAVANPVKSLRTE